MALLLYDGFDCYADREEVVEGGWAPEDNNSSMSTALGKFSGGCLLVGGTISRQGWMVNIAQRALDDTLIVGWYFRCGTLPSGAGDTIMEFSAPGTTSTELGELFLSNTGTLRVEGGNGAYTGSESSTVIAVDTWYYIEFKMTFGSTNVNGSFELRVDGTTIDSDTGIDTFVSTSSLVQRVIFNSGTSQDTRIDDVVIMDDTGGKFDNFQGELYIETLDVDADGGTVDWTRNTGSNDWEMVDDATSDDDTTYVDANTAALETRFGIPVPTITADTVKALQIRGRLRKSNVGTKTVRGLMNVNGGSEEVTFDTIGLTSDYCWLRLGIRDTNDTGGTPWDTTEVGNTEIGVEIVT